MFLIIHALLGMIIGLNVSSPWLIAILAFGSHFLLDYIPHWDGFFDKDFFEKSGIVHIKRLDIVTNLLDICLVLVTVLLFYYYFFKVGYVFSKENLVLGVFMSILPDLMKLGYVTKLKKRGLYKKYLVFHSKIQNDVDIGVGILVQLILLIFFIFVILYTV